MLYTEGIHAVPVDVLTSDEEVIVRDDSWESDMSHSILRAVPRPPRYLSLMGVVKE